MPYTPIWVSWPVKQISQLGNCRIFHKISLSKKTSKTMEEGGPSFGKFFFQKCAVTWLLFCKVRKGAHLGHPSPPHLSRDQGEGKGRWMEVIWVEGEWGESWRHLFLFSPATCLFWVFPSQLPNKGKNAQIEKRDQRWKTRPHFHTS